VLGSTDWRGGVMKRRPPGEPVDVHEALPRPPRVRLAELGDTAGSDPGDPSGGGAPTSLPSAPGPPQVSATARRVREGTYRQRPMATPAPHLQAYLTAPRRPPSTEPPCR